MTGAWDEREAVVLLHGSACSRSQWKSLALALQLDFQVYAPDLLGHGVTPPWPGHVPLSLADEARAIDAIVRQVGGPVHLVGHSYGGSVALHYAQAHPERVRSLTLIEPVAFNLLDMDGPRSAAMLAEIHWLASSFAHDANPMARFVEFWNGAGTWMSIPRERRAALQARAPAVAAHFAAILSDETLLSDYRRVTVPTLLMNGGATPRPTRRIAERLVRLLPNARSCQIPSAGHMLPVTHPEVVNTAIRYHLLGWPQAVAA